MRRIVIGAGFVLSMVAAAQMSMGNFVANPDKSIQITELNTTRGGLLQLSCKTGGLEVNFQPQYKLPGGSNLSVSYRFDDSTVVTERWNFGPFGAALYLPTNLTRRFLTLGADATTLSMSVMDASKTMRQYRFGVTGFRNAISSLACGSQYGFAPQMQGGSMMAMLGGVVDQNMAFIAPAEFIKVFTDGSSFQPEGAFLAWEYNGVKLLLQKNSTAVQSVYDNRSITLARAAIEVKSRTVVPASLVSAFSCKVVGVTKPTDAKVRIGCGAGQTYVENDLTRY